MQIEVSEFLTEVELSVMVKVCDAIIAARGRHKDDIEAHHREQIEKSPVVELLGMIDEDLKQKTIENSLKMKAAHDEATHKSVIEIVAKLRKIAKELYDLDL